MNQPKPSSSTMPLGSDPSSPASPGPSGTIVNPAAQQAPYSQQAQQAPSPAQQHPGAPQGYQQAPPPGYQNTGYAAAPGHAPAGQAPAGHAPAGQAPGGYSPYPGVAMPAGYPPTGAQQHAPLPATPVHNPGAPAARADRGDELEAGGARTMYEFSGTAAGTPGGDKRTFVGGLDDMPDIEPGSRSERSSNLKGGASSWVLIFLGVAVVGGGLTFLSMTKADTPEPEPEPAPVAEPETPAVAAASAGPETPAAETAGAAAASAGEAAPDAAAAEAEAKKKAEEEAAAKAAEEEAAKKKAEEEAAAAAAAAAKKKATTKKKTTTKKKVVTKPKADPEPDKPTRLTPKKPPRDDGFDALPKPP